MEINGTNIGAATFAMKKAMEMPNILMNLVQDSSADGKSTESMQSSASRPLDIPASTGKGKLINLVA